MHTLGTASFIHVIIYYTYNCSENRVFSIIDSFGVVYVEKYTSDTLLHNDLQECS